MKKIFFLSLACALATVTFAQDDHFSMDFPEMSRGAGISFQKFDGLNSRIANYAQYKQVKNATGVLQLGWFHEKKQFVSQLDVMAGSSMSGDRDKRSSTIRYLGVGGEIGYDFIKSEKVALFPMVGLGYQGYQARLFQDNTGTNFNSVLQNPGTQSNLGPVQFKNAFVNYRVGLGFAVRSEKHGCSVGVQGLYTGSFSDRTWRTNNGQMLGNAPSDGLKQIYAALVFTCRPFFMMKKHM